MAQLVHVLVACSLPFIAKSLSLRHLSNLEDAYSAVNSNHTGYAVTSNHTGYECVLRDLPFYVLNLDRRREDKLLWMEHAIDDFAPWICDRTCRVSAPDGSKWGPKVSSHIITDEQWQKARDIDQYTTIVGGNLTRGATALIAGHGRMWEHILQQKAEFAVVMEDDITRFHPYLSNFLCMLTEIRGLQNGWDFMMMQMADQYVPPAPASTDYPTFKEKEHVYNTGMYIIKADAAKKALQASFPIEELVQLDNPNSPLWTNLTGAHTKPALADASHELTDVQQTFLKFPRDRKSVV